MQASLSKSRAEERLWARRMRRWLVAEYGGIFSCHLPGERNMVVGKIIGMDRMDVALVLYSRYHTTPGKEE